MSKITLPNMLAFERKFETSDALMFSGGWSDKEKPNTIEQAVEKIKAKKRMLLFGNLSKSFLDLIALPKAHMVSMMPIRSNQIQWLQVMTMQTCPQNTIL